MYGFSYQGATQLLAAAEQPEGLLCIAPAMAATDLYAGWFYHHGALRLASALGWGIQMLRFDARRRNLRDAHDQLEAAWANVRTQPHFAPYAKLPALQSPGLPTYVHDWIEHTEPGDYWSALDISTSLDRIIIPALHVSGWYDTYLEGSYAGFLALAEHAATQHARDHQYLLAGPWQHIPWGARTGDANLGSDAMLDTDTILLRWFNHWLKGLWRIFKRASHSPLRPWPQRVQRDPLAQHRPTRLNQIACSLPVERRPSQLLQGRRSSHSLRANRCGTP